MRNRKLLLSLVVLSLAAMAFAGFSRPFRWWPQNDMSEQVILKPFHVDGLRAPAPGAVAMDGWEPVPTRADIDGGLAPNFKNPTQATPESIANGQVLFEKYCWACHGTEMSPDPSKNSPVQAKGMPGANIHLVKMRSDEQIYATITYGSAIMKRMSFQLSPEERWDVVNYVRSVANKYQDQQ